MPSLTANSKFPTDWYWIVAGSTTQVWSSDRSTYVSSTLDADYLVWLDSDVPSRIASEIELSVVLAAYGLTGPTTYLDPDIVELTAAGPYSVGLTDKMIFVNQTVGAAMVLALPSALSRLDSVTRVGLELVVKDMKGDAATNNITIGRSGSDTIDGATSVVISTNYGLVRLKPWATRGKWSVVT